MSGKGSSPRPYSVDQKTFDYNWDLIFKQKNEIPESEPTVEPNIGSDEDQLNSSETT